jgi:hypothetical protein
MQVLRPLISGPADQLIYLQLPMLTEKLCEDITRFHLPGGA